MRSPTIDKQVLARNFTAAAAEYDARATAQALIARGLIDRLPSRLVAGGRCRPGLRDGSDERAASGAISQTRGCRFGPGRGHDRVVPPSLERAGPARSSSSPTPKTPRNCAPSPRSAAVALIAAGSTGPPTRWRSGPRRWRRAAARLVGVDAGLVREVETAYRVAFRAEFSGLRRGREEPARRFSPARCFRSAASRPAERDRVLRFARAGCAVSADRATLDARPGHRRWDRCWPAACWTATTVWIRATRR